MTIKYHLYEENIDEDSGSSMERLRYFVGESYQEAVIALHSDLGKVYDGIDAYNTETGEWYHDIDGEIILLNEHDYDSFVDALDNPPEPSNKIREAVNQYKKTGQWVHPFPKKELEDDKGPEKLKEAIKSLNETEYLISTQANAIHLKKSIAQLKKVGYDEEQEKMNQWHQHAGLDRSSMLIAYLEEAFGKDSDCRHPSIWNERCEKSLSDAVSALADLYQAIGEWEEEGNND